MWKRLNNQKGARQPAISGPVSSDTRSDDKSYNGGLGIDVNPAQPPPERGRPPQRPPRDDLPKDLPRLPFEAVPPSTEKHEASAFRPASSIYSQHTPTPTTVRFPASIYSNVASHNDGVSPPSSPDIDTMKTRNQSQTDDPEVSPVDEVPEMSRLSHRRQSSRQESEPSSGNIPILRREKRRNQVAQAAANLVTRKELNDNASRGRKTADVRWDPYSGEITNSDKGKPQSVKPGQFTTPGLHNVQKSARKALGNESSISSAPKVQKSFGERVRNFKLNAPQPPEWKGASGRVATVSPVADQIDIARIKIPRKSSKRIPSPHSASPSPVPVIRTGGVRSPAPAQTEHFDPTIHTVLSSSGHNGARVLDSPIAPSEANPKANPDNIHNAQSRSHEKQDSAGTLERNFREAFKDVKFAGQSADEAYIQPPSRFSVTTYAPSEAQSTPRHSIDTFDRPPVPPMPSPPQMYKTNQQPPPIVNRKRPKIEESPKSTTRKAVAPSSPVFISLTSSSTSKRDSNIAKNLPQSPAEALSQDLISTLQAQLDDLAHRRNNITKSIRQMTELMPIDGVLITDEVRRKREMEKLKVEHLREEEADIRRQEHEIGLRLHRAYKRRDQNAEFESTGLWVRRVTG